MPRKKSQPPAAETNGVNSGALEMVSFTVTVDTDTEAGRRIIAALRNNPDPGALILAGLDAAPSPTPPSPDTSIKELVDALRVFISGCIRESITTLYAERDAAENAEIAESYRKRDDDMVRIEDANKAAVEAMVTYRDEGEMETVAKAQGLRRVSHKE